MAVNRILFILAVVSGISGAAMLILSVSLDGVKLLNASLIVLLISSLLLIATVLTAHLGHRGRI